MNTKAKRQSTNYYIEAIAFWKSGKIIQSSNERFCDEQFLSAPIIYLFRHSAELLLKGLIIKDADMLYEEDVNNVLFPPYKVKLAQTHSLQKLFEIWDSVIESMLIPALSADDRRRIVGYIKRIEKCDPSSTFFRYPYEKSGKENRRSFAAPMNKHALSSVPCSIGAAIHHIGWENVRCWHGDNRVAWLEIDLDHLIVALAKQYPHYNRLDTEALEEK